MWCDGGSSRSVRLRNTRAVGRSVGSGSTVVSSDDLFSSLSKYSLPMTLKYPGIHCTVTSWLLLSKYPLITLVSADFDFIDLHNDSLSVQKSTFE